jgi:hypothetical protein
MQNTNILFAHPRDYLVSLIVGFVILVHAGLRYVAPAFFKKQSDDGPIKLKSVFYPVLALWMFAGVCGISSHCSHGQTGNFRFGAGGVGQNILLRMARSIPSKDDSVPHCLSSQSRTYFRMAHAARLFA